jgi:ribonuclease HII
VGVRRGGGPDAGDVALTHECLLWEAGFHRVAGVDEVGLGPWAGPVVAAAVVFPVGAKPLAGVDDSKKLSPAERTDLAREILASAIASVGVVEVSEIDAIGVHQAGLEAMRRAVVGVSPEPDYLIVDARRIPRVSMTQKAFVRADTFVFSVAAASIVAKVHRDTIMQEMENRFPGYGFSRHMGYGTAGHSAALKTLGPCEIHRRSFAPIRRLLDPANSA